MQHPGQIPQPGDQQQAQLPLNPNQFLANVKHEFNSFTERSWNLPNPSFEIPATFTSWEFPELDNPLEIGYPTLRNFSQTIQYAIEPFEEPTRHAISRVKAVIDAPK